MSLIIYYDFIEIENKIKLWIFIFDFSVYLPIASGTSARVRAPPAGGAGETYGLSATTLGSECAAQQESADRTHQL